jgi:hypothetical protein
MNMQEGISPRTTYRLAKEGLREKKLAEDTMYKMFKLEIAGKADTKQFAKLKEQLENNLFYQMDKNGLSITVMNNVLDTPTVSKRLLDRGVKQAFDKTLGKDNKVFETLQAAYLSPQASTGQWAMNVFGSIDAMSRYTLAKAHMAKGMSMEDAITKANSIYGDMDMISPMWSQAIQQYGFVPFSNWFFRVSGGIAKSTKENWGKALGIYALLEMMESESGYRTESWNPLASLVHTPIEMLEMSPYNRPVDAARSAMMPSVYKKGINAVKYDDPMSMVITETWEK